MQGGSALKNHSACLVGARLYIYGGYHATHVQNKSDTFFFDCSDESYRMIQVRIQGDFIPEPRNGHTANVVDDKLFVFGGWGRNMVLSGVYYLDLVRCEWFEPVITGNRHSMLNMHVSEYVDHLGEIICFGGGDGQTFLNAATALDVRSLRWKKLKPTGKHPEPRANASSCMHGFTMYVFGGWNRRSRLNDIHLLHMPLNKGGRASWSSPQITPGLRPSERVGAGLASFRGKLFVFGGYCNDGNLNDIQVFNPRKETWLGLRSFEQSPSRLADQFSVRGPLPTSRNGHTFTVIGDEYVFLCGGSGRYFDNPEMRNEIFRLFCAT